MPHLYLCQADCYPLFLESCVVIFLDNFWIECHVKCQLPWWLLVSFGSYALWCLGWGLFTFRDCPEAYTELLGVSSSLMACLPLHLLATFLSASVLRAFHVSPLYPSVCCLALWSVFEQLASATHTTQPPYYCRLTSKMISTILSFVRLLMMM